MPSERISGSVARNRALSALVGFLCLVLSITPAFATDVRIANQTIHPYNGGDGEIEFDLAWDNSWRVATEPHNWDAVWVFCKIRRNGGDWEHLKLKTTGHTIPQSPQALTTAMGLVDTGAAHDASTNPAVGIFIYRTNDGFGTVTANDLRLKWSYADNGASSGDVIDIRVVGVEMVYIPEGSFYAGDNATSTFAFREKETTDNDPWLISSENAITTTSGTSGNYYYPGQGDAANSVFTIPAAFPKGYGAFYMAKGELSQNSWVAFFNMLTSTQKTTRDITSNVNGGKSTDNLSWRNNVSWTSGDATLPDRGGGATYAGVAMNFISWADLTAFLDWAGLRPMSELEYEKAGRGHDGRTGEPKAAVSGEYAWGTTTITGATSISNGGLRNERGQSGSNIAYGNVGGVQGPLGVGSFLRGVNTRIASGGGYYGVMELSGNLWERPVTVGLSTGRAFEGRYHGNGVLDSSGNPNITSWPGTNGVGAGFRGGDWYFSAALARLSDRFIAANSDAVRPPYYGGRGVRSAP
jgi:formylglycine-generating enzyme required for sulfatase activity